MDERVERIAIEHHEQWYAMNKLRGYHHYSECTSTKDPIVKYSDPNRKCHYCNRDMLPWEQTDEEYKAGCRVLASKAIKMSE